MAEAILQPKQPYRFEARNPFPKFNRLRGGDCYKITVEVTESDWERLKTLPPNALLEVVLWHHDGDEEVKEEKPKKEPKAKGPYGRFWQAMFRDAAFHNNPDVHQVLNLSTPATAEEVKNALKEQLNTDSLTFISPTDFGAWAADNNLMTVVNQVRQMAAKVEL